MFNSKMRVLTMACGFAAAILLSAQSSHGGVFDCLFGTTPSCVVPTCAVPTCVAPAVTMPTCNTCAPTQVAYRAFYQPVAPCNTCSGYSAVTTYRPWFGGWTTTRLVPYTTYYRPFYTPTVVYSAYSPCTTCSPCAASSSCGGCGVATYGAPASGCTSCAAPAAGAPATSINGGAMETPAAGAAPPKTFQENVERPATGPDLKPIPQTEGRMNSMPAPQLNDSKDRITARPTYSSSPVELTALRVQQTSLVLDNDGWQPSKD